MHGTSFQISKAFTQRTLSKEIKQHLEDGVVGSKIKKHVFWSV
jgi:hypothetical protein